MTNQKSIVAVIALIALHEMALAQAGANNSTTAPTNASPPGAAVSNNEQIPAVDKQFVSRAANANNFEIQLSALAAPKLSDDHLKVMVSNMRNDYIRAQGRLEKIAAAKGIEVSRDSMEEQQRRTLQDLAAKNGAEFRQAYLDADAEMHQQTIDLLQRVQAEGQNPELRGYAQSILPTLRKHLAMLQEQAGGARPAGSSLTVTDQIAPGPRNENIKDRPEH